VLFTPNLSFLNFKVDEFFGEIVFEAPGTYTIEIDTPGGPSTIAGGIAYDISNDKYLIPNGVSLTGAGITAVAVGAGGGASGPNGSDGGMGGGGGALSYINNHGAGTLVVGNQFTVIVGEGGAGGPRIFNNNGSDLNGTAGGISRLVRVSDNSQLIIGNGGAGGVFTNGTALGGTSSGTARDGGGDGGTGGQQLGGNDGTGGGGAGGYTGNGGNGIDEGQSSLRTENLGSGGGGAGGNQTRRSNISYTYTGGGGVALYGLGTDGTVTYDIYARIQNAATQGSLNVAPAAAAVSAQQFGSGRGIGAGGGGVEDDFQSAGGSGSDGAVRLVFGGASNPRSFPSTNVGQSGSLGNIVTVTGAAGAGDYGGFSSYGI
jgi:hypothetical protein